MLQKILGLSLSKDIMACLYSHARSLKVVNANNASEMLIVDKSWGSR